MSMLERKWKTIEGVRVDDVKGTLAEMLREGGKEVHIGTDSQQAAQATEFVTVVVVLTPGHGGRAIYTREKVFRVRSLRERLMKEVWFSVSMGLELNEAIPTTTGLTVHIDANPDVRFRSSDFVKELTSMVVSQGFKSLLKPDSWAASHAADHVIKTNILGKHHGHI